MFELNFRLDSLFKPVVFRPIILVYHYLGLIYLSMYGMKLNIRNEIETAKNANFYKKIGKYF